MITIDNLLDNIKTYNNGDLNIIKKAYEYAKIMHANQIRESGEPYIIHPLNVAYILAEMHADNDTICAALLHDILEDTKATKEEIASIFSENIANLVDGVTKMNLENFSTKKEQNLANNRKIIMSITKDIRIIIIKLADRLHNLRTLEFKNEKKQKEIAYETIEIFTPLAYHIGTYKIKNELEDLSMKYWKPEEYKKLNEKIKNINVENNKNLSIMLYKIKDILFNENISSDIKIRIKNLYSIYKTIENGKSIKDIHDLLALKVIVDNVNNCYYTLGLIHNEYKPINNEFKDYICSPKSNMYQSLHTTILGPNEKLVQTQIRTYEMDKTAYYGLTAYWDINKMHHELNNNYQILKSLKYIDSTIEDNEQFIDQTKKILKY